MPEDREPWGCILSPPFSPGSAWTAIDFTTDPLGRPWDLDKSIWMLPLLFALLAESLVCAENAAWDAE